MRADRALPMAVVLWAVRAIGELAFNIKTSHKLSKLTTRWCSHNGLDPKTVRFLTEDGHRLRPDDFIKDVSVLSMTDIRKLAGEEEEEEMAVVCGVWWEIGRPSRVEADGVAFDYSWTWTWRWMKTME